MAVRHSGQLRTCRGTPLCALWLHRLNATHLVRRAKSPSKGHSDTCGSSSITRRTIQDVNGGGKVGRMGGRLLSIGDQILYRLPSFIGL